MAGLPESFVNEYNFLRQVRFSFDYWIWQVCRSYSNYIKFFLLKRSFVWLLFFLFFILSFLFQTPLHLAVITKQPRALDCLIKAGANPRLRDRHGNTAVHIACSYGDATCLKALLHYDVSKMVLNWQNYQGKRCWN